MRLLFVLVVASCFAILAQAALRTERPRGAISPSNLEEARARLSTEPFATWHTQLVESNDGGSSSNAVGARSLFSLGVLYALEEPHSAGALVWADHFGDELRAKSLDGSQPVSSPPSFTDALALDLVWAATNSSGDPVVPDAAKLAMWAAASADNAYYYKSREESQGHGPVAFDYHGALDRDRAFLFAAALSGDPVESSAEAAGNPAKYAFNASNYVARLEASLEEGTHFWNYENRVGGDLAFVSPGALKANATCGGWYDNAAYDQSAESRSVWLTYVVATATGTPVMRNLHDECRGLFARYTTEPYASPRQFRVWSTQTEAHGPSDSCRDIAARVYQDPYMQQYALDLHEKLDGTAYLRDAFRPYSLLYFDPSVPADTPATRGDPTSAYFPGPGFVISRSSWHGNATFGVHVCGEGISRRYEDANSFHISRKELVAIHAGARIRGQPDNHKHHWYHVRSISKNTVRVYDPSEEVAGVPLVDSNNIGGQIFATVYSDDEGSYCTSATTGCYRTWPADADSGEPLGLRNYCDITRYDAEEGKFTYSLGDGADAYSSKVTAHERALVHLHPDTFVVFDRVALADAALRRTWAMHVVARPEASGVGGTAAPAPTSTGNGMRRWDVETALRVDGQHTDTVLRTLLPEQARTTVRGGTHVLLDDGPLSAAGSSLIPSSQPEDPRWLEIQVAGASTAGSVTITGDAEEGEGISEVVAIVEDQVVATAYPTSIDGAVGWVEVADATWEEDAFVGYVVALSGSGGGRSVVVNNSATRIYFDPPQPGLTGRPWQLRVLMAVGNTVNHFYHVSEVSTPDLNVARVRVQTYHTMDAEDSAGTRVQSFSPRTDSEDDVWKYTPDIGTYTVEVENAPSVPPTADQLFLHVVSMADSGAAPPCTDAALIRDADTGAVGAFCPGDGTGAMFAGTAAPLDAATAVFTPPTAAQVRMLFTDLHAATPYYTADAHGAVGGPRLSSPAGTLLVEYTPADGAGVQHAVAVAIEPLGPVTSSNTEGTDTDTSSETGVSTTETATDTTDTTETTETSATTGSGSGTTSGGDGDDDVSAAGTLVASVASVVLALAVHLVIN